MIACTKTNQTFSLLPQEHHLTKKSHLTNIFLSNTKVFLHRAMETTEMPEKKTEKELEGEKIHMPFHSQICKPCEG